MCVCVRVLVLGGCRVGSIRAACLNLLRSRTSNDLGSALVRRDFTWISEIPFVFAGFPPKMVAKRVPQTFVYGTMTEVQHT